MASRNKAAERLAGFRVLVFCLALVPLGGLLSGVLTRSLGPDPGLAVTQSLGSTAFQFLLITLALSPLKKLTGWAGWLRIRRMLGLFCFFYAALHLAAFLQFIAGWQDVWSALTGRPYIIAGFVSFVLLAPLAITSTTAAMKALGRRWKKLHQWIYPAAVAAWVHHLWQAKGDLSEVVIYGALLFVLLSFRAWWFLKRWRIRKIR